MKSNQIYVIRLRIDADPYDTTRLREPRGMKKRLQFDETIATREDAHKFIDQFYDEVDKL